MDVHAELDQRLRELADMTGEPAFDQWWVLPGEDQDSRHRWCPLSAHGSVDSGLPQGGEAEIWRETSHTGGRRLAGVYGLQQRPRVGDGALVRVVARLPAPVKERPVARLERQQLARRALGGLGRESPCTD